MINHNLPQDFPYEWATEWNEDEMGVSIAFEYKGVRVGMRWIPPGVFLMGSPETELGRSDDELQHQVTISQGFWLAETTCTQALWRAVMGANPSRFKGDDRPVERVSYEDVQQFLKTINEQRPELQLDLPTEAQWEYACRAGTTTPFHHGETITTDQVNYNGNHPYGNGPKGVYRQETVPAQMFASNAWGLYQMHGNVWEWCADWVGEYESEPAIDPPGPPAGGSRVLRGGSWFYDGRSARAAFRNWYLLGRSDDTGFRFARGH